MSLAGHNHNIFVIGCGEALASQSSLAVAKASVRYADPDSWAVVNAIDVAIRGIREHCYELRENVSVIVLSECGPRHALHYTATRSYNRVSPLHFAAANPGALCGLPCIIHGFKGRTLNITTVSHHAANVSLSIAESWLSDDMSSVVIVVCCSENKNQDLLVRAAVLSLESGAGYLLNSTSLARWLLGDQNS